MLPNSPLMAYLILPEPPPTQSAPIQYMMILTDTTKPSQVMLAQSPNLIEDSEQYTGDQTPRLSSKTPIPSRLQMNPIVRTSIRESWGKSNCETLDLDLLKEKTR